jgi:hypothetical protein
VPLTETLQLLAEQFHRAADIHEPEQGLDECRLARAVRPANRCNPADASKEISSRRQRSLPGAQLFDCDYG